MSPKKDTDTYNVHFGFLHRPNVYGDLTISQHWLTARLFFKKLFLAKLWLFLINSFWIYSNPEYSLCQLFLSFFYYFVYNAHNINQIYHNRLLIELYSGTGFWNIHTLLFFVQNSYITIYHRLIDYWFKYQYLFQFVFCFVLNLFCFLHLEGL